MNKMIYESMYFLPIGFGISYNDEADTTPYNQRLKAEAIIKEEKRINEEAAEWTKKLGPFYRIRLPWNYNPKYPNYDMADMWVA